MSKMKLLAMPGLKNLIKIVDKIDMTKEMWLVYEVGKRTLAERLYQIR